MKKYAKYLSIVAGVVVMVVLAVVLINMNNSNSYACEEGEECSAIGNDSDAEKTGGCSDAGQNCTSWGITWVKQPLDEFLASEEAVGLSEKQKQDMIAACEGMADPYVIRLAYVDFANGGKIQFDTVRGLLSNDTADRNNAKYVDPSTIPGGLSEAEAQALFNYALSLGIDMRYAWNEMAVFAFDEAWKDCGTNAACLTEALLEKLKELDPAQGGGSGATAYFQAKTTIDVGDGIPEGPQETSWDGHVAIKFSTDSPSVTVNFSHTLEYQPNGFSLSGDDQFTTKDSAGVADNPPAKADVSDNEHNYTNYTITTGGSGKFGIYTTSSASQTFPTTSQTVSLEPGETKTVCSYINYTNKYHYMKSKKHVIRAAKTHDENGVALTNPITEISHFDWFLDHSSSSGTSGACATITRPSDPTGEPKSPGSGGSTSSDIMFAGETTGLEWDIQAKGWDVRRLKEREITAHLVEAAPSRSGRFFEGYSRSSSDPYGYYSGTNIVERVNFGEEGRQIDDNNDSYKQSFSVVVPDYVGYKYCHTGGYRYESWYSINGDWKQDTRSGKNYWYVYNASCRTIAKKPTVAIWNSSFLTAGGVTTSTAPRFDRAIFGVRSENGGSRTLYGAWSEYLAAVGRDVNNFGSGASFAIGSKNLSSPKSSPLTSDNSSLTIANKNRLGSSGIPNNSTYRTRLTTFLENQATRPGGNTLGAMLNVSSTQILRYDGDLKITGNITTNPGPYSSIYHIPQVIIFVHGNLEIASDVTQIDAWLVVDGRINTCSEFVSGSTEADAVGRLSNTCSKQLAFNGPVLAGSITLNRSFGSDPIVSRTGTFGAAPAKQNAGEIFNLRMDTYLWAYAQAGRYASSYTESYTRELAPRY